MGNIELSHIVKLLNQLATGLNLVHFETWSSAGSVRLSAHAEVLPATTSREQDAPTTFKTMVLKIDVV